MPTVQIAGGHHMFYKREGRGDPVVFLHAFPLWGEMWDKQLGALGEKWQALAIDNRGFGYTQLGTGPYTIDSLAEDVKKTLDALEMTRKAVLVGLSMGGYVALSFYAQWPDRVRALVLCDTKATADTDEAKKGREAIIALAHDEKRGGMEKVAEQLLPKLISEGSLEDNKKLVAQLKDWIHRADPEAVEKAERALMSRPERTDLLPKIAVPTKVMVGVADELSTPAEMERMANAIPGAEFQLIYGAGHLSNLEAPEMFNAALTGFLAKLPPL